MRVHTPRLVSFWVGLLTLGVLGALGIGVAFGVYPATLAARLAPIDALRVE